MWEAYDFQNEDFLWSCINFMGGIASQQQAPCGAVSASAVFLGLRHRCSLSDKERAKQARSRSRRQAASLVKKFQEVFGNIICRDLLGLDFSNPEHYQRFRKSPDIRKEKCEQYVQFVVEKLYELK